ncbi:MAG: ATPase [Pseudolabrys sp.]|jgi:chromosome segregation ATPase|nr:ATPase [Pseudolabrys sp.]
MIEPIMYFGVGFLVAALLGLVIVPLVHGRAVRLTMRRLEAATPLSMAEIQADKDQLRAEFAMSTRRLEMNVEQLKNRVVSQLSELSKKADAINRLKVDLGEKTATILALEARDKTLRDQLRDSEEEFAARTAAVHDAERALKGKESELAKMMSELGEQAVLADSQRVEIAALKTQVEALKERLNNAERDARIAEDRLAHERLQLKGTTAELVAERGKVENLDRRAHDLESRLTEQSKALTEREFELRQLHEQLTRADNERERLAREINDAKHEAEQNRSSERTENALLREHISDVAAEVARLAAALEGPNSPIEAILAEETARDKGALRAVDGVTESGVAPGGNLADRIRALKTRASRLQNSDKAPN